MVARVPNQFPDIQSAVAALKVSPDVSNFILIEAPSITTSTPILLDDSFSSNRQLTIQPRPTLARAQILSDGANSPILSLAGCGYVQVQDLDIVRTITNTADLIQTFYSNGHFAQNITFQRCRIGSSAPPGVPGLSYLSISEPSNGGVMIRNCIFFSTYKQSFDYGINVLTMDTGDEVFMYNNCVADYNKFGIQVSDFATGSLVLLRNNVVVNNFVSMPEPVAFNSGVVSTAIVVTSDNTAFASPTNLQLGVPPNQDLFGLAAAEMGIELDPSAAVETPSFVTMAWDATPGAANTDFYRTELVGPLHDPNSSTDWGITVVNGSPDPHDIAVADDIEHSPRPAGAPPHTDRGPFQVDVGATSVQTPSPSVRLVVSPQRNPSGALRLLYSTGSSGELTADLFDVFGRRAATANRMVRAGESGSLAWPEVRAAGLYAYRVTLRDAGTKAIVLRGKISLVK
jgi:hypothetical protein